MAASFVAIGHKFLTVKKDYLAAARRVQSVNSAWRSCNPLTEIYPADPFRTPYFSVPKGFDE